MNNERITSESIFNSAKIIRLSIDPDFIIKLFNCDSGGDFDDFFCNQAKHYQKYLLQVTYIIEYKEETIAYYTVSNDLLRVGIDKKREVRSKLKGNITNSFGYTILDRQTFPAVKIGVLAVSKKYQNIGIGTKILDFLLFGFKNNTNKTGCLFVTVDGVKESVGFYNRNGFKFLLETDTNANSRQMYKCLL
mgnify:CR=1 FL=1